MLHCRVGIEKVGRQNNDKKGQNFKGNVLKIKERKCVRCWEWLRRGDDTNSGVSTRHGMSLLLLSQGRGTAISSPATGHLESPALKSESSVLGDSLGDKALMN